MSVGSVGPGYCAMQHPGPMPPLDAAGTVGGDPSGARREVDETRQPATENRADGNGNESGHDVLLWFRGDVGADENHITGNPDTCQVGVKVLQTAIPLPAPRPMPRLPMYGWARLPMVCVGAPSDGVRGRAFRWCVGAPSDGVRGRAFRWCVGAPSDVRVGGSVGGWGICRLAHLFDSGLVERLFERRRGIAACNTPHLSGGPVVAYLPL